MRQKVAICGRVGSGKSSHSYMLFLERSRRFQDQRVNVNGTIAYISQASWIQSGTVRDNILCGKPMDHKRLCKDLGSFNHGDLTEIGQRGINLSGGQKQRIQLAGAIYNEANIYLLDDPFSAVGAHTAEECVLDALKDKTVMLVTHQVEFLTVSDKILTEESSEWFLPEEKLRLPKISNGILVGVYTGISISSTPFV
ncbi:hypothetical protein Peur_021070 [Populus x canadensis]